MTSKANLPVNPSGRSKSHSSEIEGYESYEGIDLTEALVSLYRGLAQTIGFAALGMVIGVVAYLAGSPRTSETTSMRVTFNFSGYGAGQYPDHSNFQPDDVCAPDIVTEALKSQGLENTGLIASEIRAALTIEGLIPPNVIKERDRMRAVGQIPTPYIPDEFLISLTLPRKFPLSRPQRELLLYQIVSTYRRKFQQTYVEMPLAFGGAFEKLRNADYYEFSPILSTELQNIIDFLKQQLAIATIGSSVGGSNLPRTFRSRSTNLSFADLLEQAQLVSQIQLTETLGLISQSGLSRNRTADKLKLDYHLSALNDREQYAIEEEKVIDGLLSKVQERPQYYVPGIKPQVDRQHTDQPILDQGVIDTLVANDSYNFLVHKALDAALAVGRLQTEKAQWLERRENMESFLKGTSGDQSSIAAQVQQSLSQLEDSYNKLIANIRATCADFSQQQFADAIRISVRPETDNTYKPLSVAGCVGAFVGLALGAGLSLIGVFIGSSKRAPQIAQS
jgi:hypothetical protein